MAKVISNSFYMESQFTAIIMIYASPVVPAHLFP